MVRILYHQRNVKGKNSYVGRDLTPEKRLHISLMALQGVWGAVTELAREFMISRNVRLHVEE